MSQQEAFSIPGEFFVRPAVGSSPAPSFPCAPPLARFRPRITPFSLFCWRGVACVSVEGLSSFIFFCGFFQNRDPFLLLRAHDFFDFPPFFRERLSCRPALIIADIAFSTPPIPFNVAFSSIRRVLSPDTRAASSRRILILSVFLFPRLRRLLMICCSRSHIAASSASCFVFLSRATMRAGPLSATVAVGLHARCCFPWRLGRRFTLPPPTIVAV